MSRRRRYVDPHTLEEREVDDDDAGQADAAEAPAPDPARAVPVGQAVAAPSGESNVTPPVDGGRYLKDARVDPATGKHYGGYLVDAEGKVLHSYGGDEEADPSVVEE